MNDVTNVGTYRVNLLSSGIGATKNNFPQLILKVACLALYNEQSKQWDDWSEYDQGQTGYLTLVGKDKNTDKAVTLFSFDDTKKVFGWDGKSFPGLQAILDEKNEAGDFQLQARFVEDHYDDAKKELKLTAIAEFDAEPSREIRALDTAGLKNLDKMFGVAMKAAATKDAPGSTTKKANKTTNPEAPKAYDPPADVAKNTPADLISRNDAETKKINKKKEEGTARAEAKVAARAEQKGTPNVPAVPPKPSKEQGCTQDEMWGSIVEHVEKAGLDEDMAGTAYQEGLYEVCGDVTDDTIGDVTPQQWHLARLAAIKKLSEL